MCGIAAAYAYGGGRVDRDRLLRARDQMAPRGPDGDGLWMDTEDRVGLAHRRLAIIDLSEAGAQPMAEPSGRYTVTFNGEIYNHRALRQRLEADGVRFRSHCDTEVLLHLYARKGAAMVEDLRGMFAFAIWDAEARTLFLARDPYGIKPLYLADDGRQLWVASQVRALLAAGGFDTAPDPAGHAGFFLWGHVPEPHTLYKGIRALPAGCTLTVTPEGPGPARPYARLADALRPAEGTPPLALEDAEARLREALLDSVRHHLEADVEVGVFLSAGLDSTTLAALTAEAGGRLRTVTLAFDEYRGTEHDEAPLAEAVAAHYGARHDTVTIGASGFAQETERLFDAMDQPSLDGVNSYFVSQAAAQAGLKVALSGLGGDELFGGYPSFREVPRLVRGLRGVPAPQVLGRGLRVVTAPVLSRLTSPKYAGLLEYGADFGGAYLLRRGLFMPWELPQLMDPEMARQGWSDLQARARLAETTEGLTLDRFRLTALESAWYMRNQLLRDTDWASMAHSLEVRTPLVDWQLLQDVAPLLAARPDLGKQSMARTPAHPLPEDLLARPKTGFTTPVRRWMVESGAVSDGDRGLRGWARHVYGLFTREPLAEALPPVHPVAA
jgi:asparagine synthase (glutamine-hydrolysing)